MTKVTKVRDTMLILIAAMSTLVALVHFSHFSSLFCATNVTPNSS